MVAIAQRVQMRDTLSLAPTRLVLSIEAYYSVNAINITYVHRFEFCSNAIPSMVVQQVHPLQSAPLSDE